MQDGRIVRFVSTALLTVASTFLVAPAGAADWKVGIWGPPRSQLQPLDWYAKEVATRSGGRMKMDFVFDAKATGIESLDWMKGGQYDATYVCTAYFGSKTPLSTVMDLPLFAPDDPVVLGKVELALADHPAIVAELKRWNVKMLVPVPLPQYQLMGNRRVTKVEDLRGLKVRVSAETGKILEEYGASVHPMQMAQIPDALRSGKVDVVASSYPVTFAAFKLHEVSKHVTEKISLGTQMCYFGVSEKSWDALPAQVQKLMADLRAPAVARYEQMYAQENAQTVAMFKQKGLEFATFNPTDRARLVAKAIKYWQSWVDEREKQGLPGREVMQFTQAKIREFSR